MTDTAHGVLVPRGLTTTPTQRSYDGRFGRMFQSLAQHPAHDPEDPADDEELRRIAAAMAPSGGEEAGEENRSIPSGYVYLGQFVDHDITFDPASQLQRRNDPEGLLDFRTPRFDLDSVYGGGPSDEPFQYDSAAAAPGFEFLLQNGLDMPRNSQGRALIGDPRNDENGIVSQLHVAFLRLHNRLMADLAEKFPDNSERFKEAQRRAQWHYQWVVAHDFIRRTIGADLHDQLLTVIPRADTEPDREIVRLRYYRHKVHPYMPVEFSVAAYRFGHSQVRDRYNINSSFNRSLFSPSGDDFRGFQALRSGWQASWPFFFELDEQAPQLSQPIDTLLAPALATLQGATGDEANLALRNLRRGAAVGLPSGQAVAVEMGISPIDDSQLDPAAPGNSPLWFYILREADVLNAGRHLGPVGGRIVGETLLGLLRADPQSYLSIDPSWVPTLPTRSGTPRQFDMGDLLLYAVPDQAVRS